MTDQPPLPSAQRPGRSQPSVISGDSRGSGGSGDSGGFGGCARCPGSWLQRLLLRRGRVLLAVYWPLLAVSTHMSLTRWEVLDTGDTGLDKARHFGCFGLLALLLIYALPRRWSGLGRIGLAAAVAVGYAGLDEWTQGWFDRTVDLKDFLANVAGIAVMVMAATVQEIRNPSPCSLPETGSLPDAAATSDATSGGTSDAIPGGGENSGGTSGGTSGGGADDRSESGATRFVGHAMLVGALTFVSRVMGMGRDLVMAACFGMSALSDAFWIGFIVPNLFRRLFGEGALTASFIPVYAGLVERDPPTAKRLVWLCVGFLLVVLGLITLLGELVLATLPSMTHLSSDSLLAIRLTMIMLPYMPMVCVVALMGGVLQVHHRFGPPAVAPILLNVMMIIAAVASTRGADDPQHLRWAIHVVAWSEVITGLVQVAWVGWAMLPYAPWTTMFDGAWSAFKEIMTTMLPMTVSLAVFQINTLADSLVAWGLSPKNGHDTTMHLLGWSLAYPILPGAVTALQYAQRLYQFPLGVFGIAVATAIFPMLSRAAPGSPGSPGSRESTRQNNPPTEHPKVDPTDHPLHFIEQKNVAKFRQILQHGLRLTMFIGLPATAGLILLRQPLVRLIFERGQFTPDDTARVATILAAYSTAIWAYSMSHVLQRAYYALKDAKTPLRISLYMVAVNVVLNLTLVWWMGAAALAMGTAVCAILQVVLMVRSMHRHVPQPVDHAVLAGWWRTAALTAAMTLAVWPIVWLWDHPGLGTGPTAGLVATALLAGFIIVFGGAKILGLGEVDWMVRSGSSKRSRGSGSPGDSGASGASGTSGGGFRGRGRACR